MQGQSTRAHEVQQQSVVRRNIPFSDSAYRSLFQSCCSPGAPAIQSFIYLAPPKCKRRFGPESASRRKPRSRRCRTPNRTYSNILSHRAFRRTEQTFCVI